MLTVLQYSIATESRRDFDLFLELRRAPRSSVLSFYRVPLRPAKSPAETFWVVS